MTATAMRIVNAVPSVVDAAPGLLSSLDLPVTVPSTPSAERRRPVEEAVQRGLDELLDDGVARRPCAAEEVAPNAAIPATIATVERAARSWWSASMPQDVNALPPRLTEDAERPVDLDDAGLPQLLLGQRVGGPEGHDQTAVSTNRS